MVLVIIQLRSTCLTWALYGGNQAYLQAIFKSARPYRVKTEVFALVLIISIFEIATLLVRIYEKFVVDN